MDDKYYSEEEMDFMQEAKNNVDGAIKKMNEALNEDFRMAILPKGFNQDSGTVHNINPNVVYSGILKKWLDASTGEVLEDYKGEEK